MDAKMKAHVKRAELDAGVADERGVSTQMSAALSARGQLHATLAIYYQGWLKGGT